MLLVDSCVLLDVLGEDPVFGPRSRQLLSRLSERNELAINQVIFAEVSVRFPTPALLDSALPEDVFRRLDLSYPAAFLAGKAFFVYRRRGGTRTSPLTDFFIGAHAAVLGIPLVTRDVRRFRRYFPSVELIVPA